MGEKAKVLVVDDQYIARSYFEMSVSMSTNYVLAGALSTAEQAVRFCLEHPVDLVVMDVMMKYGLDGLTCARTIKNNNPEIKIILVTSTAEYKWMEKAKAAGIEAFWFKEYAETPLIELMDQVMAGRRVYPDDPPNPAFGNAEKIDLTDREQEILRELTMNRSNEEIAEKYGISPFTVKRHIQNILDKTGYENRLELAVNAKAIGLVVHEDDRTENRAGSPSSVT